MPHTHLSRFSSHSDSSPGPLGRSGRRSAKGPPDDVRRWIADLQRQVEQMSGAPCLVRIRQRRGWPDPAPITEIVVQSADVTRMVRNTNVRRAIFGAFHAMFEHFEH